MTFTILQQAAVNEGQNLKALYARLNTLKKSGRYDLAQSVRVETDACLENLCLLTEICEKF